MKTFGVLLVAAYFVACAHSFPRAQEPEEREKRSVETALVLPSETKDRLMREMAFDLPGVSFEDSADTTGWNLFNSDLFGGFSPISWTEMMSKLRQRLQSYFWSIPDIASIPIPEGANTTSTVKVINGHVVTINESTYTSGDDSSGVVFHVRVIDVKPENETETSDEATTLPTQTTTLAAETSSKGEEGTTTQRNVETAEEFDNEIPPKSEVDTLTA